MGIIILVCAILAVAALYYFNRKDDSTETDAETTFTKPEMVAPEITAPKIEVVEAKIQKIEETATETAERLKNMVSTDSEKPFAKISAPDLSDIPVDAPSALEEILEVKEPKAKRQYKKRAPKENPAS